MIVRYVQKLNALLSILLTFVLLPTGANAGWGDVADGTSSVCASGLIPGRACYYDFADTTDGTPINVTGCGSISASFNADEDGTNTGATIYFVACEEPTISTNHCINITRDQNGDGVVDASDDVVLTGAIGRSGFEHLQLGKPYIGVDVQANAGSDDARAVVICHP